MSLLKSVQETVRKFNLLSRNDKLVVGVSGGPDSVALILLLKNFQKEFKLGLHVAHLDHQLRSESCLDEVFVNSLAQKLNVGYTSKRINLSKKNNKGLSEEAARQERLNFLFAVAKRTGANKLALGHNHDDQAETVLMRLIRGTGLFGLSSILPKRRIGKFLIIRPLIESPRSLIESYLKRRKVKVRFDSSNKNIVFFRNRIRNSLLPELSKSYNPNIKTALANVAKIAACDYDYLEQAAVRAVRRVVRQASKSNLRLNLEALLKLHPAIARLVLRSSVARLKGSTRRLTFKHIQEIEDLVSFRPVGSVVNLPSGICVLKDKRSLCIYQNEIKQD